MPVDLTPERITELRLGCGVATLRERLVVSTPEELLSLLDAAERVRKLEDALEPFVRFHYSEGGKACLIVTDAEWERAAVLLNSEEHHAR